LLSEDALNAIAPARGQNPKSMTLPALTQTELSVADAVGSLMEFWGFKRQLGRVWTILFLSDRPLAAPELCERLRISTGLLSMSLGELRRWGVVRSVEISGDRKEHFEAETNIWRMVARVLRDREKVAVEDALAAFQRAIEEAREVASGGDPAMRSLARFKLRRLEHLADLSRSAINMLRILIDSARVDAGPLKAISEALARRS
jgi:DNA-binding transcriptional regulator GbsR (MarR family)